MNRKLFLTFAPLALLLTGCDIEDVGSWGSSDRFKEDFHYTYPLKSGGSLTVDNFNGSIEIISWEKDEVELNGTKYAGTADLLSQIRIEATNQNGLLQIRTIRPEMRRGNAGAKYILRVPRKIILNGIVSSNGSIRVENTEGEARLQSSNGSIRVRDLNGKLEAKTSNASVEGINVNGDFFARSSNGHIRVENLKGAFEAETSNASITARIDHLPPGRPIKARSSNGSIDLTLPDYKDQSIDAETGNSGITLHLPSNINADLRAATSNANVSTDFEVTMSGTFNKHRLEGRIGSGGPTIRVNSSNGGIRILKM